MAEDEIRLDPPVEEEENKDKNEAPTAEERAKEFGWKPLDEFEGNEEDFVDAEEFLRRKPLYDEISRANRKIKNQSKVLHELKQHYNQILSAQEEQYKERIDRLNAQLERAADEGDAEAVKRIHKQISESKPPQPANQTQEVNPAFLDWVEENPWYNDDKDLREYADFIGTRMMTEARNSGKEIEAEELYSEVEKKVKEQFPNKFEQPRRVQRTSEGTGQKAVGAGAGKSRRIKDSELSDEQFQAMKSFERQGLMTPDEYKKQLVEAGFIKR